MERKKSKKVVGVSAGGLQLSTFLLKDLNIFVKICAFLICGDERSLSEVSPSFSKCVQGSSKNLTILGQKPKLEFILDKLRPNIEYLNFENIQRVMPEPLSRFVQLKKMKLSTMTEHLAGLEQLTCLEELNLFDSKLIIGLKDIINLKNIKMLDLSNCSKLSDISALLHLTNIEGLSLKSTAIMNLNGIKNLLKLKKIDVTYCRNLIDVTALQELQLVTQLSLSFTPVPNLHGISNLTRLELLKMDSCYSFTDISDLGNFMTINSQTILYARSLQSLEGMEKLQNVRKLCVRLCEQLCDIRSIASLTALTELDLRRTAIMSLNPLSNLFLLEKLHLDRCKAISTLAGINNLSRLTTLTLAGCTQLENLFGINNLSCLTSLHLAECVSLSDISSMSHCLSLYLLDLSNAMCLQELKGIEKLRNLKKLSLFRCVQVQDISSLSSLERLTELDLQFTRISTLFEIRNLTSLATLKLAGCLSLEVTDVSSMGYFLPLESLDLGGVISLKTLKGEEKRNAICGVKVTLWGARDREIYKRIFSCLGLQWTMVEYTTKNGKAVDQSNSRAVIKFVDKSEKLHLTDFYAREGHKNMYHKI